jgi:SAM-dependent methyltransferase
MSRPFDDLIAEADAAPIVGWDFSWLDGRATEERPPWGYARLLAQRTALATRMVDLQSGGGEVLAELDDRPPLLVATEGWLPNVDVAARRLRPLGVEVVAATGDDPAVPLRSGAFDLVTSRHPTEAHWVEIARLLAPGGTYLSQQVGTASMHGVSEAFLGPFEPSTARDPQRARQAATDAGLDVVDLRTATLRTEFFDVGALVYYLRLVVWIVPDFSVDRYRDRLRRLHDQIQRDGRFVAHATRFLIEARKRG